MPLTDHRSGSGAVVLTYTAEVALTRRMVVIEGTADGQANDPAAANNKPLGVALYDAEAGQDVDVLLFGPTQCVASAAISRGDLVAIANAAGQVATITAGQTTGDERVVGKALSDAGAAGDFVTIFVGLNDYVAV